MRFFVLFAFALAGSAGWTFSAEPLLIEVAAEKCDRKDVPASCELPKDWATKALLLTDVEANQAIACQVQTGSPLRLFWMLDELPKGATRRYRIEEAAEVQTPEAAPMVSATEGERDLLLSVQGKPVLKYQHAVMSSDDPAKPFYKRSGFIHPIYDPLQRELTEAMPPDHMHQHGIMFAWVNAEFEGRKVDFWNSHKEQGEVRHAKLVASHSGPVFASFSAQLEHLDDTAPGGPKV
ncbi:MAG TPA: DUF6807 family protein, partial [Pirellulales bacterium]